MGAGDAVNTSGGGGGQTHTIKNFAALSEAEMSESPALISSDLFLCPEQGRNGAGNLLQGRPWGSALCPPQPLSATRAWHFSSIM